VTTTAHITATGESGRLYWVDSDTTEDHDRLQMTEIRPTGDSYSLTLPAATNRNSFVSSDTRFHIGGRPYVLVEQDTQPPSSTIAKLVPTGPAKFLVTWRGQDQGSGLASYDLWIGRNDEPLQPWQTAITTTQAEFTGTAEDTYRFTIRARDNAGNVEPVPTAAQASTRNLTVTEVGGVVLGPNRQPVTGASIIIEGEDVRRTLQTVAGGTWSPIPLLPDSYALYASAPGFGTWPAPRRLDLTTPTEVLQTLAPPDNAIIGGDFEGNTVWSHWKWAGQVDLFFDSFDGQLAARLGRGKGEATRCPHGDQAGQRWSIGQQILIPAEGEPTLSFLGKSVGKRPSPAEAWLEVGVVVAGDWFPLIFPGELWQPSDWTLTALDLTDWRGQTVEIQFQMVRCSEQPFSVLLDRVSVGN
jgi:hypothetical protein